MQDTVNLDSYLENASEASGPDPYARDVVSWANIDGPVVSTIIAIGS